MRRRATFIVSPSLEFDPSEIQLRSQQLLHPGLKAAREERLTYTFKEIPTELADVLQLSQELHLHWVSENSPESVIPFSSRLPSGLHVQYKPHPHKSNEHLCPLLQKAFSHDLKCSSTEASFSRPIIWSDSSSASLQYYSLLPSLNQFVAYIQRNVCTPANQQCFHDAGLLNIVDYLDLDYDNVSQKLTLSAFWARAPPAIYDPIGELTTLDQWPLDISSAGYEKVEVGILSTEPISDPHELQFGGFLTVVGRDEKPKTTQFSFASRHHQLSNTDASRQPYNVSFQSPTGLHPTMEIKFPSTLSLHPPTNSPDTSTCALHAYLTLPSSIFADEYAFTAKDPLFEKSHNLRSLRSISGELDLEAPDYVVEKWGSTLLLELATPDEDTPIQPSSDKPYKVTIPLHLRYQAPAQSGVHEIRVPWPTVFWACTADQGVKFHINPFDRTNLGYDSLFEPNTMFYYLKPGKTAAAGAGDRLVESIQVPVLDTAKVGGDAVVERVTLVVILLGFGWILLKLWPGLGRQMGVGVGGGQRTSVSSSGTASNKKTQ